MEPDRTIPTGDLHGWELAVYLCNNCEREWYDDNQSPNPISCPYCNHVPDEPVSEESTND